MVGDGWSAPPTALVAGLARATDVITILITMTAAVLLLATFRDGPLPRRVTRLTGIVAALGVVGTGGTSLVMNLLTPHEAGEMYATNPATAVVLAGTAVSAALVLRSAARSLRFARASRSSDEGTDPQVG
jgi:hypothetical protein